MTIEQRLERAATAVEAQVAGVPQRPTVALEQRNRRHRVLRVAAGGALVVMLLVGSAFLFRGVAEPTTATTPPAEGLDTVLLLGDVDWVEVDQAFDYPEKTASSDEKLYVLSTSPGEKSAATDDPETRPDQAIYSSADGIDWEYQSIPADLWITALDTYDGKLYAVSTAPAESDGGEVGAQVATSGDEGATWQTVDLELMATPPTNMGSVVYQEAGGDIAAGPAGVVVTVHTWFGMDYAPLIPDEYQGEQTSAYQTADGIRVVDYGLSGAGMVCEEQPSRIDSPSEAPETTLAFATSDTVATTTTMVPSGPGCVDPSGGVVYAAIWDELGIEPPVTRFNELFVSNDGVTFEPVPAPFAANVDLIATADGFLAIDYSEETARWRLWSSPDGHQWSQLETPPGVEWVVAAGEVADRIVLVGRTGGAGAESVVVFTSSDRGSTWGAIDAPSLVGHADSYVASPDNAEVGPGGVTVVFWEGSVSDMEDESFTTHIVTSEDLESWREIPLPNSDTPFYVEWILSGAHRTIVGVALEGDDHRVGVF